jgi:hypothetical protein
LSFEPSFVRMAKVTVDHLICRAAGYSAEIRVQTKESLTLDNGLDAAHCYSHELSEPCRGPYGLFCGKLEFRLLDGLAAGVIVR